MIHPYKFQNVLRNLHNIVCAHYSTIAKDNMFLVYYPFKKVRLFCTLWGRKENYQSAYHSNQLNWNSFGKNDAGQSWQLFIFGHCQTNKGNHYLSADQPYIVLLGFMLLQYNTQLNPGNKIGLSHWVKQTSRAISLRTLGHRCPRKLLVNRDMSR